MLNAIKSELYKIRKNRIVYVCFFMVIVVAVWIVWKELAVSSSPLGCEAWVQNVRAVTVLFLSIASGFVITFLVQREYEDKTIINVLAAPTSRNVFMLSKLTVWLLWYLVTLGICIVIYIVGGNMLYPGEFGSEGVKLLFTMVAVPMLMAFLAATPLLLVAVMQRRTFYPTIMCSLAITGIELLWTIMPIKFSSIIPWSAAMLVGYGLPNEYISRATISVLAMGVIGILSACILFRRQNQ